MDLIFSSLPSGF